MRIAQLLGGFDDLRDGLVAGKKREKEAIGWFGGWDGAEEVGILGHWVFLSIESINSLSKSD